MGDCCPLGKQGYIRPVIDNCVAAFSEVFAEGEMKAQTSTRQLRKVSDRFFSLVLSGVARNVHT